MPVHGRGRYPRPPTPGGTLPRRLRRRLVVLAYIGLLARVLLGLLARLRQQVKRALDPRDHACSDAGVARRRIQFVMSQKRLDDSYIGTRSSRCVAKLWRSVCRHTLFLIPAPSAASWNSRLSWRVDIGWPGLLPGNSQRSWRGVVCAS